jgi:hypothetical protein
MQQNNMLKGKQMLDTIIHMERRSNRYIVPPLKYWDFIDLKKMQNDFFKDFETNTSNEKVR